MKTLDGQERSTEIARQARRLFMSVGADVPGISRKKLKALKKLIVNFLSPSLKNRDLRGKALKKLKALTQNTFELSVASGEILGEAVLGLGVFDSRIFALIRGLICFTKREEVQRGLKPPQFT